MKVNLFISLLLSVVVSYAQDKSCLEKSDSSVFTNATDLKKNKNTYLYITRHPDNNDYRLYKDSAYLINLKPTAENYQQYFELARAVWNLGKVEEAKKMFLRMIDSGTPFIKAFNDSFPAKFEKMNYLSELKNEAYMYLAKNDIEVSEFENALFYLDKSMNEYKPVYTCGTMRVLRELQYLSLYSICYKELKHYKKYIDLVLPEFITRQDDFLIDAIKEVYKPAEISDYLVRTKSSITCIIDSLPSVMYTGTNEGKEGKQWDTIIYYSSSATINLFNRKIALNHIFKSKENKEVVRNYYLNFYEESEFYKKLFREERTVKIDR